MRTGSREWQPLNNYDKIARARRVWRLSDVVRTEAEHRERPAVLPEQQADLVVVRVGVQRLVVLLVLHLVLRGLAALGHRVAGLCGAGLRGALLPPLGASVLEPHLNPQGRHFA